VIQVRVISTSISVLDLYYFVLEDCLRMAPWSQNI